MNTPCKFDGRHGSVAESKSLVNYTSNDRCLGKTITNLRVTADLNEVAVLLDSGQTEKLSSKNSVEQYCASEAISVQFSRSNTFKKPVQDNRRPPNGNHVKRATYSLEQVLRSLDEVMASGKAILEALATANSKKLSAKQGGDSSISGKPLATKSSTGMKRGTYELGKVADMLDTGVRNGVSLNDSLNGVSHGNFEENGTIFSAKIQRNTYDLSDESTRLDDSQQSEISLEELLKELGCEGNGVTDDTMASTKYKRGTYGLDHVSGQLDDSLSSGKCLEDSLEQISLENNNQYNQSVQDKRRTYDLCDVSSELDQRLKSSSPLDDSLCQNWTPDTGLDPTASDKRRTYNLNNVSNKLDRSLNSGQCVEDSLEQISSTDPEYYQSAYEKRRTYDLTDVSLNFHLSQQDLPRLCGSSTPDKSSSPQCSSNEVVIDSSTLPKNNTDTNGISGREDAAEKRKTYTVDNSPAAVDNSLSNGSNIQNSHLAFSKNSSHPDGINGASYDKPAASILSGNNKKELTPGQWIEQMEELENSPEVSSVKTKYSKSRKECSHKEINSNGSDMKNGEQQVSCTSEFNFEQSDSGLKSKFETRARLSSNSGSSSESSPRSTHVKSKSTLGSRSLSGPKSSSGLSFGSSSEIASRSLSCSRPTSELKSNSSPDFTSSSGPSFKKDCLVESLKEISPGVRNYLTNKLGLTEEQCIAVHRKLSNGSEKSFDSSSLEHHKTYSMEDVAHSLDIATSQGLPMTKVLNNLELENQKVPGDDGVRSYENIKTIQNNMKEHLTSRPSAVEQQGQEPDVDKREQNTTNKNDSKRSVKLRSNIVQSKFSLNRRTYTLSSGSYSVDGKPSFKLSATKAVYKPSAKLHSFSHLLGGRSVKSQLRNSKAGIDESKRNTYTLESVAETLEKAQDEGVTMIDALKRLSGSCSVEQSESCAEKRKTYSLEDVSNTLESGTASGVPIVDTLRKIADPDGTESGKSSKAETPSQSSKKKAPPKPKRTFSKPEIKFVSDSFVIEYFTSPKKPQSTSSEKNGNKSNIQEAANKSSLDNAEKLDGQGALSGTQQTSANEGDKEKAKQLFTSNEISSLKRGELKPKEKVVNDLDNLLVKLAAEVDKTKELDLSGLERNPSASCGLLPSVAEPAQDSTGSSMNLVEKPCEESVSKTVKPIADSHHSSADCEPSIGFEGTSDSDSAKPELKEANTEKLEDVDPCDEAVPGTSEEMHDVLKPVLLQQVENSLETVAEVEKAAHTEAISVCIDGEIGDKKLTVPIQKGEIPFSNDKMCSGDDCLHSTKPEMAENELDADVVPRDQLETIGLEETSYGGVGKTDNVGLSFVPDKPDGCRGLEDGVELSAEEGEFQLNASKSGSSQSTDNKDSVSLELNLLRLKLAEKQRHIEAQKQRTREQMEEERKRFGQNVFWFAVGKEKEKKEQNGIKSPKEVESKGSVEKPQSSVYRKSSSEIESLQNNKFDAFTKQSSLEEELPPSMGKLQDRTYSLKTIDESLTASNGDPSTRAEPAVILPNQPPSRKGKNIESQIDDLNSNRNTTGEVIHEFRLSRQASKSQDPLLSKAQMTSRPDVRGNSGDFATQPEKRRAPVVNYKSRISVPLTYSTKPVFESSSNENGSGNDMNPVDVTAAVENEDPNQASSPTRKRWDIDSACQAGPQLAVSKSNYGIFGKDSCSGMANTDDNRQAMSENVQESRRINQQAFGDLGIPGKTDNALEKNIPGDTRSPASSDEQTDLNKKMNSEKVYYAQTGNGSDGRPESASLEANGNSPDSEDGSETPKKGLALFIGDQNAVRENGLTPEQLRKRERFLKNRQQKLEEEKMKKEAILEKKRRKEEKMKEIQLRREKEELSRQARLQEKREQAEIAKQERQRYELHRKENLPRSNVVDGISSGYRGLTRTEMNQHASSSVTNGGTPFRMNGPLSTPPSAFSGFTGVESYVKPSGKTNRKLIINAISHVCLPGAVNKEIKDRCLQAMTESSAQHFLILFREGLKFRGLYSLDPESNQVLKVHGVGPRSVTEKMIQRLYKYNSGGKEFSELPAKGFSLSVDGFTLQKSCWQSNKPSVASKTVSNYKLSYHKPAR